MDDQRDEEPVIINLGDVKPPDPQIVTRCERAYRKGILHALALAHDMLADKEWNIEDLAVATDIALDWRFDGKPHPALCDELIYAVAKRKREMGVHDS